jgi:signal transduction histidine kinase
VIKGRQSGVEAPVVTTTEATWRCTQVFEREMRRVAKDVQDVCQLMSEMSLQVDVARKTLAANPAGADSVLGRMWEQLSVVVRELGYYAVELAPAALEEGNLLTVLKQYSAHYHACYGGSLEIGLRSDDLRMSHQTALGMFRALQSLMRGVGNSEASRDTRVYLSVEDEHAVAIIEFERIRSSGGAMGDPIGEMEERIALIGGQTERQDDDDRIRITCRAPVGQLPPGPRAGAIVVS